MRKWIITPAALALVVGGFFIFRSAVADTRIVYANWMTDPTRHVCQNYVRIGAASADGDVTIGVHLIDPQGKLLNGGEVSNDPNTPFTDVGDVVEANCGVMAYPSGTNFTVKAEFKDASGQIVATKQTTFVKP